MPKIITRRSKRLAELNSPYERPATTILDDTLAEWTDEVVTSASVVTNQVARTCGGVGGYDIQASAGKYSKDGLYYIKAVHANKGYVNDDILLDYKVGRDWKRNTPAAVFGKCYGFVVRKVLYRSFNRFHPTSMENAPKEMGLNSEIPEEQSAGLCGGVNGYYQVFLTSRPFAGSFFASK